MQTALVTGADRNLGLELCRELLRRGWRVFGCRYDEALKHLDDLQNEYPDSLTILRMDCSSDSSVAQAAASLSESGCALDMVIHNAAVIDHYIQRGDIAGEFSFERFDIPFNVGTLGAIRLTERLLPLMQSDGMKRLCYISSEAASVAVSHRVEPTSYGMSKTALNMAVKVLFNKLRPRGFTFRLFHPGWMKVSQPEGTFGKFEPRDSAASALNQFMEDRSWEDMLVMVDNENAAWPF